MDLHSHDLFNAYGRFFLFVVPLVVAIKSNNGRDFNFILGLIASILLGLISFVSGLVPFIFKLRTPNDMILFDKTTNTLILNLRKRKVELKLCEIKKIDSWAYKFNSQLWIYPWEGKRIVIYEVANINKVEIELKKLILHQ